MANKELYDAGLKVRREVLGAEYVDKQLDAAKTDVPGGYPVGGVTIVDLPNNHLQYAVTWYGLAAALAGGGSFFGEIALLTDAPRTATVTATSPARVLVITGQAFQRVLNETTTIRPKVLTALAERAGASTQ